MTHVEECRLTHVIFATHCTCRYRFLLNFSQPVVIWITLRLLLGFCFPLVIKKTCKSALLTEPGINLVQNIKYYF